MPSNPPVILTAAMMQTCDLYTIDTLGIPSQTLMESAARCAGRFLLERRDLFPDGGILVLCGSGNNGGDGFAMARFLSDGSLGARCDVRILYTGRTAEDGTPDTTRMSAECARQYRLAVDAGLTVLSRSAVEEALQGVSAVADAVFGIGLDRPVTGEIASLFDTVKDSGRPVLAVDIPSGVDADTGKIQGTALPALATVTMQALKSGLLLYPGAELCGEIAVCDPGISLAPASAPYGYLADTSLLRRVLLPRDRRTHKGTYGTLTLLCGSEGMCGAAVLATRGALRSGAGLVRVLTPACNRAVLQTAAPEAIVSVYGSPEEAIGYTRGDGLVIGCGLGVSEMAKKTMEAVLNATDTGGDHPLVIDADGLNLLAEHPALWHTAFLSDPQRKVVITPHPAEMARLCGESVPTVLTDLPGTALRFARERGVTVVLKDAHTVIASPDGSLFICAAGNAGMARGGSGDVLAGIIGSLLTQNRDRLGRDLTVAEVAAAGVYLHAAAGDLAAKELGEYGMLPSDLIERIPTVCRGFSDSRTRILFN